MKITLSPVRLDSRLCLEVHGETLILNGEALDLSVLPEGATLPRDAIECRWLASDIERIDGVLTLTLVLPHGGLAPQETLFPGTITVTQDGPVPLPPYEPAIDEEPMP